MLGYVLPHQLKKKLRDLEGTVDVSISVIDSQFEIIVQLQKELEALKARQCACQYLEDSILNSEKEDL